MALTVWLGRVVRVRRGVDRARVYWSRPRGDPGGLVYVALGDSAAQGVGASRPWNGYVGQLAETLRQASGNPVLVINLSVSGAKVGDVTKQQLPRLADLGPGLVPGLVPDVVTVAIGGNDVLGYDRDRFGADVARLVAGLPRGTFVADVPYFMHGHWETDSAEAAGMIRDAAREAGLVVVPLNEELRREGWSAMLTQTAADAFHPNDRGHAVWARAFWRTMDASGLLRRTERSTSRR